MLRRKDECKFCEDIGVYSYKSKTGYGKQSEMWSSRMLQKIARGLVELFLIGKNILTIAGGFGYNFFCLAVSDVFCAANTYIDFVIWSVMSKIVRRNVL